MFWDGFQWVAGTRTANTNTATDHNATRRNRRLYVANLPFSGGISEDQLAQIVIQTMRDRKLLSTGGNPVLHVWFSKDRTRNYGFLEMATIEDAEKALTLDGLVVLGETLTIRRPTEYAAPLEVVGPDTLLSIETLKPLLLQTAQPLQGKQGEGPWVMLPTGTDQEPPLPATSSVLRFRRALFWASERTSNDEFLDAIDDIGEGLGRMTNLKCQVFVARADVADSATAARVLNLGDVLVECADQSAAELVMKKIKNRKYDGQGLVVSCLDQTQWRTWIRSVMLEMNADYSYTKR